MCCSQTFEGFGCEQSRLPFSRMVYGRGGMEFTQVWLSECTWVVSWYFFWRHAAYKCLQHNESCDITATEDGKSPAPKNRWSRWPLRWWQSPDWQDPDDPWTFPLQNGKRGLYSQIRCGKRHPFARKDLLRKGDGVWAPGVGRPSGRSSAGVGSCFATLQELEQLEAENLSMWRRAGWSPCKGTLGTLTRNITWSCNVFAFFSVHVSTPAPMEGLRNQRIANDHSPQWRRQELWTHGQGILGGLFSATPVFSCAVEPFIRTFGISKILGVQDGVRGLSRMCCISMVRKGIYGKL